MCDVRPSARRVRMVTARLVHACYSCGFPIVRGEVYRHDSGVWDGRGEDYRRHQLCALLDEAAADDDGCWLFGGMQEVEPGHFSSALRRTWATVMRADVSGSSGMMEER